MTLCGGALRKRMGGETPCYVNKECDDVRSTVNWAVHDIALPL